MNRPHATAPLNDTTAYNHPSRLEGDNRIRNRSLNAATAPSHMKQPQQLKRSELELNKRKSYGDRVRQQAEDRLNTPDYTTGSDTGGKATTFEFPSYESFHKLRDSGNGKGISGTGDQRAVHHLQVNRRLNRRDSSDDDEEEDDGDQGVAYPRRPIPDRPRPRSAHFGDFDDEHLSFRRRHDVDNRLRRQSTRQSIELGRLKMQEKDDEIKPAVAISSVITGDMMGNTRGNPSSRFGTRGEQGFAARSTERLDGIADQGIAAVALTRRQSEMVTRLRDDVIEAKVVLLGSQGKQSSSALPNWC
ncbi:hypothetical protein QFC19_004234 [Naganishia cerealis]|uniref:Uncharacterized protein n=1 Tax=Naganishia cerealis TaxID=610337 RepID=A0ACC2VW24_9TREE|nr:hypothetical protein QFC19_004234 [Naganishia cerealis]